MRTRQAVAASKTKFSTCPFSLRSSYNFLDRKAAAIWKHARLLQGSLETPAQLTYDFSRWGCCLTILVLSFEGRKSAVRTPCSSVTFLSQPPSLIRVFAFRLKKARIFSYPLRAQWRFWPHWADAQADLSLRWAHMPFCWVCHDAAQIMLERIT